MQKIKSLFKRDYEGTHQVYDELVPGTEWVAAGEGNATLKIDGTSCRKHSGKLYKRYDRRLTVTKLLLTTGKRQRRKPIQIRGIGPVGCLFPIPQKIGGTGKLSTIHCQMEHMS